MDSFHTIISPRSLKGHLDLSRWIVVDTRFSLANSAAGPRAYQQAHIPGAIYADLDTDLAGPVGATTGRHPLPDPADFARRLGEWGIGNTSQVVAYDDAGGAVAARLWWMLRWLGHENVAILDGGIEAWKRQGFPLNSEPVSKSPARFRPDPIRAAWLSTRDIETMLGSGSIMLIDSRAPARYAGEQEPIDKVAGHIPGAINAPFSGNLDENEKFLDPSSLKDRYRSILGPMDPVNAVCMCGSGVTAAHNLLAMEHAGLHGAKLYVGSWSEWITDPSRPVIKEP